MKPERIQFRYATLEGWVLEKRPQAFGEEEPNALWTAFELADHMEACELVFQLGRIADQHCACPEIEVRRSLVFVRATTPLIGLTEEDFDFAAAVDLEIGGDQRPASLLEGKAKD